MDLPAAASRDHVVMKVQWELRENLFEEQQVRAAMWADRAARAHVGRTASLFEVQRDSRADRSVARLDAMARG